MASLQEKNAKQNIHRGCGVREWINVATKFPHGTPYLSNCPPDRPPLLSLSPPISPHFPRFGPEPIFFVRQRVGFAAGLGGRGVRGAARGSLTSAQKTHTWAQKHPLTPTLQPAPKKLCHTNHITPTTATHIRHQIRPALKREHFQVTARMSATKMSFLTATYFKMTRVILVTQFCQSVHLQLSTITAAVQEASYSKPGEVDVPL